MNKHLRFSYDTVGFRFNLEIIIKRKKKKEKEREKQKEKKTRNNNCVSRLPVYNIRACNAKVCNSKRLYYCTVPLAEKVYPKTRIRTVCSGESVVSSLTHRLGADLPREKYGATAAAMRCEEKQSAVRFHVPEAGINERCLGAALPLSFRLVRDACTRAQSFGSHNNRGTRHSAGRMCTRERDTYGLTALHEEKHGRPTTRERNPTATRRIVVQPERLCASRNSMVKANCTVDRPEKY